MLFAIYLLNFLIIALAIFTVGFLIYVLTNIFFILFLTTAPAIQTDKKHFPLILSKLPIGPQTVIADLGCSGGDFLLAVSRLNPKECVGYELSLFPFLSAKIKASLLGRGRVKILMRDFFKVDWSKFDILYFYLVPSMLQPVKEKLVKEAKAGAMVMVKGKALPDLEYVDKIVLDEKIDYCAYIYKF
jgi:hypothetical protein